MNIAKFNIGQQVRHQLLNQLGVIIDIDAEYALLDAPEDELSSNERLRNAPWYHVVIESAEGEPIHTYLAEAQLVGETPFGHRAGADLDQLALDVKQQLDTPRLRN